MLHWGGSGCFKGACTRKCNTVIWASKCRRASAVLRQSPRPSVLNLGNGGMTRVLHWQVGLRQKLFFLHGTVGASVSSCHVFVNQSTSVADCSLSQAQTSALPSCLMQQLPKLKNQWKSWFAHPCSTDNNRSFYIFRCSSRRVTYCNNIEV